jgi:Myb DNA-binding like
MSFRKHKRSNMWSELETDLFYEVLAATGTDFGLMHDYIPIRTRTELKVGRLIHLPNWAVG